MLVDGGEGRLEGGDSDEEELEVGRGRLLVEFDMSDEGRLRVQRDRWRCERATPHNDEEREQHRVEESEHRCVQVRSVDTSGGEGRRGGGRSSGAS